MRPALAFAVLALCGCDWSLHRMQEQPKCAAFASGACAAIAPPAGAVELGDVSLAPPPRPATTRAELMRGEDRFERFCAPCHGLAGDGDSAVARAMARRKPPSLVDATVRAFPDTRIETAISHGYGLMPAYAGELVPRDRWAIVDYVRALQSRDVAIDSLTPQQQEAAPWLH
jgi:mono/diheme cytochrome c family protein|nr:cytochrome c [Kofleriaceae bacterium]